MEVTCERCSTVYDFDDALVSERGTTVKCTTCSHQFKVRRTVPTTGPDVWIVRTVDGREIEFGALRDLQSNIYDGRVTREDVLVRGSSRPRRLGSIAELEPFFNRTGMTAPSPQRRARTLAGGASAIPSASQRSENSAVFSLPNLMRSGGDQEPPPSTSVRRSTLPPPPPMPMPREGSHPSLRRASIPPPAPIPSSGRRESSHPSLSRGSIPPPSPMAPGGRRPSSSVRFGDTNGADHEDEYSNAGIERVSALPPPPPLPRRSVPPPPPMFPAAEPPPPPAETMKTPRLYTDPDPTKISKQPTPASVPTPSTPTEAAAPTNADQPKSSAKPKPADQENVSTNAPDKPSADKPDAPATTTADPPKERRADTIEWAADESLPKPIVSEPVMKPPVSERSSAPGSIPMPSSRGSEPYSDPRYSGPIPSRRAGAARWIVGFVLLGCTALAAVTIGPKLVAKPSANAVPSDARVSTLLEQGDRAMNDGDLDAANEAYVKASALADNDARIELRLARLAIVRADIPWLKVRLSLESDPDLANTRRELVLAAARAHQAAERAQAILPNDPDVTRCRINALRLQGNVAEARKLVVSLLKPTGVSNDEVLFALLDLAEPSPTWLSVIERLSNAARGEQNLGHARSMLIYALVQSGDIARAKSELDQLVAMPRPHPLIAAFRAYIAQAEKETSAAGTSDAGGPKDDDATLQLAIEATTNGELEKAAGLLKDLEIRLPTDARVLTAAGKLALKKQDRPTAVKYFDKAVAADKNSFDAMIGLADIKWESGDKQGASFLYRQIIERGGADNPHMAHAKERFSAYIDRPSEEVPE